VYRANDGTTWTGEPIFSPSSAPTARRLYQNVELQAGTPNKIRFWHNSAAAPAIARIEITKA